MAPGDKLLIDERAVDIARVTSLVRMARSAMWLTPHFAAEKLDMAEAILTKLNNDAVTNHE